MMSINSDGVRKGRLPRGAARIRILGAAPKVFARLGYAGATIDAIAAEAGLTKGAVYSNFTSKDDLFFTLLSDRVSDRVRQMRMIDIPPDLDLVQRARAIGDALFDAMVADPDWQMLFLEFWSRAVREPEVRARYASIRSTLRAQIGQFIAEEAARSGARLPVPVDEAATIVLALANGLFIEFAASPQAVPPTMLGDTFSRMI